MTMDDDTWYLEYFGIATDESLAHYGVKGMKWGQRKERIAAGVRKYGGKAKEAAKNKLRAMGQQTVAAAKAALAQQKQNRVERKEDKRQEKINAKMDKKINKMDNDPNYVKRMSDEELAAAIQRKKLEQEYATLSETPMNKFKAKVRNKASDVGAEMVGKALETIGMGFVNTASAKIKATQEIKKQQAEEEVKRRLGEAGELEIANIIDMMGGWKPEKEGKITSADMAELKKLSDAAKDFNAVYSKTEAGKAVNEAYAAKKKAEAEAAKKPKHMKSQDDEAIEKMAEQAAAKKAAADAKAQQKAEKAQKKEQKKAKKREAKVQKRAQKQIDDVMARISSMTPEQLAAEMAEIEKRKQ